MKQWKTKNQEDFLTLKPVMQNKEITDKTNIFLLYMLMSYFSIENSIVQSSWLTNLCMYPIYPSMIILIICLMMPFLEVKWSNNDFIEKCYLIGLEH